ncbi:hypothetical protein Hs30E_11210 [Lactococcus hodotermopsidis]|uniref:Uncharacterized protein n=1 Tax=Pseudolactococcus hodotermopsidis TaxID=2709157 RepID=A0A6A0BAY3_9LACT|nr:hypothetical protein [Lactococcus hodotermopsidis]GFH42570.1 hypothetical protein Hs30E_11210 [Lactococcus hodotermopsidis]
MVNKLFLVSNVLNSTKNKESGLLDPFVNIVLYYILTSNKTKTKTNFTVAELVSELKTELQYNIPEFPMRQIFLELSKKRFITKENNTNKYRLNQEESTKDFILEYNDRENELKLNYSDVLKSCKDFVFQKTNQKCNSFETLFDEFIADELIKENTHRSKEEILNFRYIAEYVEKEKDDNSKHYDCIMQLRLAKALEGLLLYYSKDFESSFKNLTIYIDTPIVFYLLGITMLEVKDVYLNLVKELQEKGAKIAVFEHTAEEVENILEGSKKWVESNSFDISKASLASEYYFENGYNKNHIDLDIARFRNQLKDLKIDILEKPDESENKQFNEDTKSIEELIKKRRTAVYEPYNESIKRDVNSINSIYILRRGCRATTIQESKFIFLTTSYSLIKAASEYMSSLNHPTNREISSCISDIFLGTLLWSQTKKNLDFVNIKLTSQIYAAYNPSHELAEAYAVELNRAKDKQKITETDFALLQSRRLVEKLLFDVTNGDVNNVSDKTPGEILKNLRKEAEKKGSDKTKQIMEKELTQLEREKDEDLAKERTEKELQLKKTNDYIENIKNKADEKWRKCNCACNIIGLIALILCLVIIIIIIIKCLYDNTHAIIGTLAVIVPLVLSPFLKHIPIPSKYISKLNYMTLFELLKKKLKSRIYKDYHEAVDRMK